MNCAYYYVDLGGSLGSLMGYPNARMRISEFDLVCSGYFGPAERIHDMARGWFSNGVFEEHEVAELVHDIYKRAHSTVIVTIKSPGDPTEQARLNSAFQKPNLSQWIFADPELEVVPLYR